MLQLMHTVTPVRDVDGGAASAQLQCQFQTTAVVSGRSCGTVGVASSDAQFQYQFQTRV
jgi:hypothetical protein